MNPRPLLLKCSDPDCTIAQTVMVERSGVDERLAAIRAAGWEACTTSWTDVWCPAHTETRRRRRGAPCAGC